MLKTVSKYLHNSKKNAREKILFEASNFLYKQDNPYIPYKIINQLSRTVSINLDKEIYWFVDKKLDNSLKSVMKQLLLMGSPHLIQQCIVHQHTPETKLSFYLPKQYLECLDKNRIRINYFNSTLYFVKFMISQYIQGFKILGSLLFNSKPTQKKIDGQLCSIHGAPDGILPRVGTNTFLHWLDQESPLSGKFSSYRCQNRSLTDSEINFNKKIFFSQNLFEGLSGTSRYLFAMKASFFLIVAGLFLAMGRWQLSALSKEILYSIYYKLLPTKQKADCYIYFCHDLRFRPLWTCQAEQEGRAVINVFYASSYTLFIYKNNQIPLDFKLPFMSLATWDHLWVQSNNFKMTLSKLLDTPSKIDVVGAFPFTDYGHEIPALQKNEILIFDVDPSSNFLEYTKHGYIIPNYTDEIVLKFWADLFEMATELNVRLVHKRKRNDPVDSEKYQLLLSKLEKNPETYRRISESVNTYKLIKNNRNSRIISIPFTSTGELSVLIGAKKSAYYNPISSVSFDMYHSNGTLVLNGQKALRQWLNT